MLVETSNNKQKTTWNKGVNKKVATVVLIEGLRKHQLKCEKTQENKNGESKENVYIGIDEEYCKHNYTFTHTHIREGHIV